MALFWMHGLKIPPAGSCCLRMPALYVGTGFSAAVSTSLCRAAAGEAARPCLAY